MDLGDNVNGVLDAERSAALGMLASAFAGRALSVDVQRPGEPPWTDGQTVFVDPSQPVEATLVAVAVQASMIAAGSFDPDMLRTLARRSRTARRYLAIEGHRALAANATVLPRTLSGLVDAEVAQRSDSPAESLRLAASKAPVGEPPTEFGVLRVRALLAAAYHEAAQPGAGQHAPRSARHRDLQQLSDDDVDDTDDPDLFSSPVGGGGFLGSWLKKMLSPARKTGRGGGPPGADNPTHRINTGRRGALAMSSLATAASDGPWDPGGTGLRYPEWDANRGSYRADWCTVVETVAEAGASASSIIDDALALRRPLARLGMGLHRRHRQAQGDDIDIDAVVEAHVEARVGSVPGDALYLDSLRRRRDLSVLLLLDISGSAAEAGTLGRTVHQQQRSAVANLAVALHDLGDRVALYAYYSQGRAAVTMVPVKRFDDHLDSHVMRRLNSLQPGAYSRLGAAIRHGSAVVQARGGTSRRLLVVVSDGLAYDHGYERAYGAADARRALSEARRRGTGCVCLTVGAGTDADSMRRVFGGAAHASIARPDQLASAVGPLFRSAIRSAEVKRRVS